MNFTIDRTAFLAAAEAAARTADPKSPSDLLRMTLVRTQGNGVEIFASDMTLAIATRLPAMVLAQGAICLPAKELKESLAALPKGEVNFELRPGADASQGMRVFLRAGRRTVQLPTLSADGFPPFAPEPAAWLTMPAATLLALFRFAKHAVCEDKTRPHMCGVRIERTAGTVTGAATDGHRLAMIELPVEAGAPLAVTVPTEAVTEILKAMEARPEAVSVSVAADATAFLARIADVTVFARLADTGGFPPAKQVIPTTRERAARIARAAMVEVLRAMLRINQSDTAGVKLSLEGATIDVRTTADGASGQDLVDCELEGKPLVIGFNARYLVDALDAFGGSEVVLELGGELDPGVVRSPDAVGSLVVLMPMRV
jgi:DNA polymerase-3 subunit beta